MATLWSLGSKGEKRRRGDAAEEIRVGGGGEEGGFHKRDLLDGRRGEEGMAEFLQLQNLVAPLLFGSRGKERRRVPPSIPSTFFERGVGGGHPPILLWLHPPPPYFFVRARAEFLLSYCF